MGAQLTGEAFTVQPARYAKGKLAVRPLDSRDGFKGRTSRLIDNLSARWTGRDGGYLMSPRAVANLQTLHEAGFDGCMTFGRDPGAFRRPDGPYGERLPLAVALKLAKAAH